MSVPTLLALAGTALMAAAIFIPPTPRPAAAPGTFRSDELPPSWPQLVEPAARGCDVAARLDLVEALAAVGSSWALDVLSRAAEEERDPAVIAAIAAARASGENQRASCGVYRI